MKVKKITLFCKLGSEKVLKDMVGVLLKKKIPRAWYFRLFCFLLEVRSAGEFEISQCFAVFFVFLFVFLYHVESRLSPV